MKTDLHILYLTTESLLNNRSDINTLFLNRLNNYNVSTIVFDAPETYDQMSGIRKQFVMLRNIKALLCRYNEIEARNGLVVIQVRNLIFYGVALLIYSKLFKKKFCFWMSFPVIDATLVWIKLNRNASILKKTVKVLKYFVGKIVLYKALGPYSDHMFVQSKVMKKNYVRQGIKKSNITSVPMGVDEDLISQIKNECHMVKTMASERIVLYVGALDRERDIELVLRAFYRAQRHYKNIRLVLIGSAINGEDIASLKRTAENLSISDKVIFLGRLNKKDVFRYIIRADVGISTIPPIDIYECSSPTKIVEYVALGLPTVANSVADQKEFIHYTKGGICVDYSESQVSDAILKILSRKSNYNIRSKHSMEKALEKRGYNQIAIKVIRTYRKLYNI